jgi:FlaA1/EpsC-like NDP-sugar epimerase
MAPFAFYFCKLSRGTKVSVQLVADTCLIVFSFIGEMLFRLEDITFLSELRVWAAILATAAVTLACFQFLGLYHSIVRSLTSQILLVIGKGALVASITLYAMGLVLRQICRDRSPPFSGCLSSLLLAAFDLAHNLCFARAIR